MISQVRAETELRPERGPVVIIANPASMLPGQYAAAWQRRGFDVRLVSNRVASTDPLSDSIGCVDCQYHQSRFCRTQSDFVLRLLQPIEKEVLRRQAARARRAVGEYGGVPEVSPCVVDAFAISEYVRRLKPQFVFGMEAFAHGLATAWCWGIPRIIQSWGGDVFLFGNTTTLASLMMRHALRHADLVVTGSLAAKEYVWRQFKVPLNRLGIYTWGIDRIRFARADEQERQRVCRRWGIPADTLIVLNSRRFRPLWGSEVALDAFLRLARERPRMHFVMLGGAGTEEHVAAARERLRSQGLLHRFLLIDGNLPLEDCAELMSISDVFVSLMFEADMRSASVLQAAAAGGAPVVTDGAEWRNIERLGFRGALVNPRDVGAVVGAIRSYADDPDLRRTTADANLRYVSTYEDPETNHTQLLTMIARACDKYRGDFA